MRLGRVDRTLFGTLVLGLCMLGGLMRYKLLSHRQAALAPPSTIHARAPADVAAAAARAALPLLAWRRADASVFRESLNATVASLLRSEPATLLYAPRAACADARDVLVYSHIPKCAGSSLFLTLQLAHNRSADSHCSWFPPPTLGLRVSDLAARTSPLVERDSYVAPGCASNDNRAGVHCSASELRSCVSEEGLAETAWPRNRSTHNGAAPRVRRRRSLGPAPNLARRVRAAAPEEAFLEHGVRHFPPGRRPVLITVIREPIARFVSELQWGVSWWCGNSVAKIDPNWWPWPASLCAAAGNGSTPADLRRWAAHDQNPARNRMVSHLAAELRAPAATRDKYCIFSHSRYRAAWPSGGGGALNGDRDALERAWRVLRRDHWFAAVLGDGHDTRDAVLIFEHLLGLPVVGAPNIAQRFRLAGANQGGQHRSCESTLFHGCTRNVLTAETAREIAAANQADVALYESAKSAYEEALARARAAMPPAPPPVAIARGPIGQPSPWKIIGFVAAAVTCLLLLVALFAVCLNRL